MGDVEMDFVSLGHDGRAAAGGFTPAPGASFDLLDAGAVAGSFDAVNLPALEGGLTWDTSQFSSNGSVSVVPEPTSALLLLCGTGLLALRRRRN